MRKIIALIAVSLATASYADCSLRKEIISVGGLPVDNQQERYVQTGDNQFQCVYSFKVLVDKTWQWAEKYGTGKTSVKACLAARDAASTWLLERDDTNSEVSQRVTTVCDTAKKHDFAPVKKGQQVNISDLTIDPKYVNADGTIKFIRPVDAPELIEKCSIFLETEIRPNAAIQNKGYVCQTGRIWIVWKKWENSRIDN
jgi:hypothetical protein